MWRMYKVYAVPEVLDCQIVLGDSISRGSWTSLVDLELVIGVAI